jgi:hypothetical protein
VVLVGLFSSGTRPLQRTGKTMRLGWVKRGHGYLLSKAFSEGTWSSTKVSLFLSSNVHQQALQINAAIQKKSNSSISRCQLPC